MTTQAKAKAKTNETFIVQASLTIITNNCQNIFIVQAIGVLTSSRLEHHDDVALVEDVAWRVDLKINKHHQMEENQS